MKNESGVAVVEYTATEYCNAMYNNLTWFVCPLGSGYPYVLEAPAQDFISGKQTKCIIPKSASATTINALKPTLLYYNRCATPSIIFTKWSLNVTAVFEFLIIFTPSFAL